jgi:hypothetical protein
MLNFQQTVTLTMQQVMTFVFVTELLLAIPLGLVLKRLGFNPLWALLSFFPALGIPALWLLAFLRWPRDAQLSP